jgi:hypothetical protein
MAAGAGGVKKQNVRLISAPRRLINTGF